MSSITEHRFEIDTKGFKTQMSEMPTWRLIQEIISNSFDEKSVKGIECVIENINEKLHVEISDDGNGFKDYKDIFTLYKDSDKRVDPESRGRFNLGEKQFFAVAENGLIKTKNFLIRFYDDKREIITNNENVLGVIIHADFVTNDDKDKIIEQLRKIIPPQNKLLKINNITVEPKTFIKKFKAELMTPLASGKNQKLVMVKRQTDVMLYELGKEELPMIYELGLPIQHLDEDIKWHVDIRQKVPQVTSRDVVSTKYLQKLYAEITKNTLDLITTDNAGSNWISQALKKTDKDTTLSLLEKRYGTSNIMIESTTDYRANEQALEAGVHLIKTGELDSDVKDNLKGLDLLKYVTKEFGTNKFEFATPVTQTDYMEHFAKVCKLVAKDTIQKDIDVEFVTTSETSEVAGYRTGHLSWNVKNCGGVRMFESFNSYLIGVLIHELAHDKKGNNDGYAHLSHDFINEMERIAGIVGKNGISYYEMLTIRDPEVKN